MTAVILHLSDIHIRSKSDPILSRAQEIASCTFSSLQDASHLFVVISGDIAFSGEENQYDLAIKLFLQIRAVIEKEANIPVSFIAVPGNHDCNFGMDTNARRLLVNAINDKSDIEIDDSIITSCTDIQQSFFKFRNDLEEQSNIEDDLLWRNTTFEVEGRTVSFECLNVSWVSKLHEESGSLHFPIERYNDKSECAADLCVLVMHHPLNWFSQSNYRLFREFVRKKANVIITGHEHYGNVGIIHDSESKKSAYVEGCALQNESGLLDSSFNLILIDLERGQFSSTKYAWDRSLYLPTEEGSWRDYHDLPSKGYF